MDSILWKSVAGCSKASQETTYINVATVKLHMPYPMRYGISYSAEFNRFRRTLSRFRKSRPLRRIQRPFKTEKSHFLGKFAFRKLGWIRTIHILFAEDCGVTRSPSQDTAPCRNGAGRCSLSNRFSQSTSAACLSLKRKKNTPFAKFNCQWKCVKTFACSMTL